MFNEYKKLKIPKAEKQYIMPEPRQKLFLDMLDKYKTRCPDMSLSYAYLNHDAEIPIDYVVMFSTVSEGKKILLFDTPYLYSDRAVPGYRYCVRENKLDDFFSEAVDLMTRISEDKFTEYVNIMLKLSMDEDSPLYWKKEENISVFIKGLLDLSARFTRQK